MAYTLPDLDYDYAALEPHLSAEILEYPSLGKHHVAYVVGLNTVVDERPRPGRPTTTRHCPASSEARLQPRGPRAPQPVLGEPLARRWWPPRGGPGPRDRRELRRLRPVPRPDERGHPCR